MWGKKDKNKVSSEDHYKINVNNWEKNIQLQQGSTSRWHNSWKEKDNILANRDRSIIRR